MTQDRVLALYARLALGTAFLSAVAARFGLWGRYSETRGFADFVHYTGEVLSFLPARTIPFFAVAATIAELTFGCLLIAGVQLRRVAIASALLLATFAVCMTISFGIKSAFDYSVFSASACAALLARRS